MTGRPAPGSCLNCGAGLQGRFCAHCGQRAVPPFPTLREMLVDAWHELTVFDGRLLRTLWMLLRRPGTLTLEYLAGRRTAYLPPLRLYLAASLVYFLIAAFTPSAAQVRRTATLPGDEKLTIDLLDPQQLTPQQRADAEKTLERAPPLLRPLLTRAVFEPELLRAKMLEALPRMLFVLVPVFAAIVAVFYRRPFSQHLVFALYLHAAVFMVIALGRLTNLTGARVLMAILGGGSLLFIAVYSQLSFRTVYGDSWPRVLAKSVAIAVLYLVAGLAGLLAAFTWAALT